MTGVALFSELNVLGNGTYGTGPSAVFVLLDAFYIDRKHWAGYSLHFLAVNANLHRYKLATVINSREKMFIFGESDLEVCQFSAFPYFYNFREMEAHCGP